ncbi:MAG: hypothetical protein J6X60_13735, partial [Ruminiclostridium sp.]|nr:hypothetical protein [Ruminiclostridium sp.]
MKNKKLLVQVGIIVTVFFIALIIVLGTVIYTGTTTMYLNAKNEMIDRDILRIVDTVNEIPLISVLMEYWETHPEETKREITAEEHRQAYEVFETVNFSPTIADFNAFGEIEKRVFAREQYINLSFIFNEEQIKFRYD